MKRLLWCFCMMALLIPMQLNAQSIWTSPTPSDGVTLEGYKPNFDSSLDDGFKTSFPSSAWFLSGRYSVHPSLRLGAEVGISHYGVESDIAEVTISETETAFGNILLNAQWLTPIDNLSATVGVRIPTATENMGVLPGLLTDLDRTGAFEEDMWTISGDVDFSYPLAQSFDVRVKGGPLLFIDRYESETETEFGARYAVQGWYEAPRMMVGAGLLGRTNFTMDAVEGLDRTDLAVGGSLIGKVGRYQPGVNFQVPITSNYADVVDWVVGVSVRVPMF